MLEMHYGAMALCMHSTGLWCLFADPLHSCRGEHDSSSSWNRVVRVAFTSCVMKEIRPCGAGGILSLARGTIGFYCFTMQDPGRVGLVLAIGIAVW